MQAWSASVCGVVITAAASAVSGGVGYATARRQAVSELSALRGELSELRAMLTETRQGVQLISRTRTRTRPTLNLLLLLLPLLLLLLLHAFV